MATRKQHMGQKIIEADNGLSWERKRGSSTLSVLPGIYQTWVFGITYKLEKFEDPKGEKGWYLYCLTHPAHFWGEFCATNLLPAIDAASDMIAKAALRGKGFEKKEERS